MFPAVVKVYCTLDVRHFLFAEITSERISETTEPIFMRFSPKSPETFPFPVSTLQYYFRSLDVRHFPFDDQHCPVVFISSERDPNAGSSRAA